jgi:hypothetical protein
MEMIYFCVSVSYIMKQILLQKFRLLQHYFLSRSKYDIHSPFAYRLHSEVLTDRTNYPGYPLSVGKNCKRGTSLSNKDCRLLFRLSRFFEPGRILIIGEIDMASLEFLEAGYPGGRTTIVNEINSLFDYPGVTDMVCFSCGLNEDVLLDYFSRIMQHIHNDSVLIFCKMHRSKGMGKVWDKIKNHASVTLTFDLFNLGLVFNKEGVAKEEFILRY